MQAKVSLRIVGMPCASCLIPVRKALERVAGVRSVGANYVADLIVVEFDPEVTGVNEIVRAVEKAGYHAMPMRTVVRDASG